MIYPMQGDYDVAMQNFGTFARAARFRGGRPRRGAHGLVSYSGGFCIVYPVDLADHTEALRCWIKDPGQVKARWGAASAYLAPLCLPYFADFGYVDQGLVVNGRTLPIGYMHWVTCPTLRRYIEQNIASSAAMRQLAEAFKVMVADMHMHGISHGDLQDGNIMVHGDGGATRLILVDYDSLYVPTMPRALIDPDPPGVPAFQHPRRKAWGNERADYFSELVIYLSLCAYAEKPALWDPGQEKRLLFGDGDLRNPDASAKFRALQALSPEVQRLGRSLRDCCVAGEETAVPLEQLAGAARARGATFGERFAAVRFGPQRNAGARAAPAATANGLLNAYFAGTAEQPVARPGPAPAPPITRPRAKPGLSPALPRLSWQHAVNAACAVVGAGWGLVIAAVITGVAALLGRTLPILPIGLAFAVLGASLGSAGRRRIWPAIVRRGLLASVRFGGLAFVASVVGVAVVAADIPPSANLVVEAFRLMGLSFAIVFCGAYFGLVVGTAGGLVTRR